MVAQVNATAHTTVSTPTLHAKMAYVKPPRGNEELFVYKYELPNGVNQPNNLDLDEVEVPVADLRTLEDTHFGIVQNGFQLERFQLPADIDWDSDEDVCRNVNTRL